MLRSITVARLLFVLAFSAVSIGACGGGAPSPADDQLGDGGDSAADDDGDEGSDGDDGNVELAANRPSPPDPLDIQFRKINCDDLVDDTGAILAAEGDPTAMADTELSAQLTEEELPPEALQAEAELFHGLGILCMGGSEASAASHLQNALELQTSLSQESLERLQALDLSNLPDDPAELFTVLNVQPEGQIIEESPAPSPS
jgi:hypothetical protein